MMHYFTLRFIGNLFKFSRLLCSRHFSNIVENLLSSGMNCFDFIVTTHKQNKFIRPLLTGNCLALMVQSDKRGIDQTLCSFMGFVKVHLELEEKQRDVPGNLRHHAKRNLLSKLLQRLVKAWYAEVRRNFMS